MAGKKLFPYICLMQPSSNITRFTYFKIAFVASAVGIFTYQLIVGLFDTDFSVPNALWNMIGKSCLVAITSALILGLLNAFLKYFPKKTKVNP